MRVALRVFFASSTFVLSACAGITTAPVPRVDFGVGSYHVRLTTIDRAVGGPCSVSTDGFIWYALRNGFAPPIDVTAVSCERPAILDAAIAPTIPDWARPAGPTQAIFVATSLQESYAMRAMHAISRDAVAAGVPMTWMIGNPDFITHNVALYDQLHASYGDDVEVEDTNQLYHLATTDFPFFAPAVSVEGAGHERDISGLVARGDTGFWGVTWNSHGTDDTSDEGTPWGSYCSDIRSYKRPSPTGDCSLVSFEWTARDLTRAYFADTNAQGYSAEAAFSTDPDDLLDRGGFDQSDAQRYERALVDAYAAGGVTQPIVMMSQQETHDEFEYTGADDPVLSALYQEVTRVGMKAMTLRTALPLAKSFSARPRAIAFPYLPGGMTTSYNGVPFTPATIDFHDNLAGMTFVSGHTLPSRIFTYALDPVSAYNHTLVETTSTSASYPRLTDAHVANGALSFSFDAPEAVHFGIALWTDPEALNISGSNVVPAGRAGVVVTFDLPRGPSTQTVLCGTCESTTFPYSY